MLHYLKAVSKFIFLRVLPVATLTTMLVYIAYNVPYPNETDWTGQMLLIAFIGSIAFLITDKMLRGTEEKLTRLELIFLRALPIAAITAVIIWLIFANTVYIALGDSFYQAVALVTLFFSTAFFWYWSKKQ